ncbi:MAG: hypothetical protein A3A31_01335 [Candidatus Zambryskibacteria bacterium RIFCSPLOWO2_01_FULL_48_25]|uniref:Uncharacterized protein n=1 Tax=Candidatus Zambryskibacteria bacterium RIFCSPHIGHO2_01_FULL_46_25 TaxID=1802738 RepID=A0A1G2SZA6_9BACT|nr:MAG: hypothetical protein A2838_02200 [Candidatus Zambryskibacteria bacterium RIFCSPHIGHO2_01_FULL_46_25]OHB06924.1 MAG: hypothetical protein A3A31_01335 [Candidatus Zambryskibacteria bacterium RIFCSPLOWO2_01_FULL_48_25]
MAKGEVQSMAKKLTKPKKNFSSEREGQIQFFVDLRIDADVELTHNTDGVYKGTLFEFKLTIPDINKALFQAIKYLSHRRVKGDPIPAQILLVALNEENAYLFNSQDFLSYIEIPYAGAASKDNADFGTNLQSEKIDYSNLAGLRRITEILDVEKYTQIHIDLFDVVGWSNRFYLENPTASKIKLFKELRAPKHFAAYIYPWTGDERDFKYIMDLLNDKQHKKELGAFYTPPAYCLKATELVRKAIKQIPKGHDYIILDRCAGTGNLEEFLTDKSVDDITIGELGKYVDRSFKKEYISSVGDGVDLILGRSKKTINEITLAELKKYETSIKVRNYIFDNELSHTIVNTYELKEWIVLYERIGDRVKLIIPPPQEVSNKKALVEGGDALSSQFVTGQKSTGMTKEYSESIAMLSGFIKDKKTNIILLENPPYRDEAAKIKNQNTSKSFVYEEFKKAGTNEASHRELANLFIWSGWKHYLTKPDDYFVLFSPIKYWKSLGLGEKKFIDGFLFNRQFFHAGPSAISCILWQNMDNSREKLTLKAFDIDTKRTPEQEDDEVVELHNIEIRKVHRPMQQVYKDIRTFSNDIKTEVVCELSGIESDKKITRKAIYNDNIVGHLRITSYNLDPISYSLTRTITYNGLEKSQGFYLRSDNFVDKLPLFAAKLYPQKNWYERDVYFTTADGGDHYLKDKDFLKSCFIFACLSQRNHCRSFDGSDGRFYKNELCFDKGTLASSKITSHKLTKEEQDLLDAFSEVLSKARSTKNYDKKCTYGTYQIDEELNSRYKNENDEWIYNYPELNTTIISLKTKLAKYYENIIQPKLFEYELLK